MGPPSQESIRPAAVVCECAQTVIDGTRQAPPETCTPSDPKFACARTFGLDEVNRIIRPSL
jgi:hypothetical protein